MTLANILFFIALACMLAVFGSLMGGIVFMTKGHEKDHRNSNKAMRLRVMFQGLALLFLLLSFLAR